MKPLSVAVLALTCAAAQAQQAPLGKAWHTIAATDSSAALALIAENHPGVTPELGDHAFQAKFALAREHVQERLPKVDSYAGYVALMKGMAADFQDDHIWSHGTVGWSIRNWAGIVPIRRGGKWVVGLHEAARGEPSVLNAEITECDGQPFDRWARERINGFYGNARIEAVLARSAPALLLDDANPFLPAPKTCAFRTTSGQAQTLTLVWREVPQATLMEKVNKIEPPAAAGMGVSAFDGGYWIALGSLSSGVDPVVNAVHAQAQALREAPMVVVDVRGNGGGASQYADAIARELVGDARFDAVHSEGTGCDGAYWRVSPGNLQQVSRLRDVAIKFGNARMTAFYRPVADDMGKALGEHRVFSPALPACAQKAAAVAHETAPSSLPASLMKGRLVLVTDRACFSSCLLAADLFRRLGALHVGEATNMTTRYMEVREITLPSGMSKFSTLQKVALDASDFGPYAPAIVYPGLLADDAALKQWVAHLPPQ